MTDERPIGTASMAEDGTIHLDLRAEGEAGEHGMALFSYPPSHPEYQMVLRHLGGLKPGEEKLVPPWPDEPAGARG
jgi:hypothetical protein